MSINVFWDSIEKIEKFLGQLRMHTLKLEEKGLDCNFPKSYFKKTLILTFRQITRHLNFNGENECYVV
jgi:hypothetical protein